MQFREATKPILNALFKFEDSHFGKSSTNKQLVKKSSEIVVLKNYYYLVHVSSRLKLPKCKVPWGTCREEKRENNGRDRIMILK